MIINLRTFRISTSLNNRFKGTKTNLANFWEITKSWIKQLMVQSNRKQKMIRTWGEVHRADRLLTVSKPLPNKQSYQARIYSKQQAKKTKLNCKYKKRVQLMPFQVRRQIIPRPQVWTCKTIDLNETLTMAPKLWNQSMILTLRFKIRVNQKYQTKNCTQSTIWAPRSYPKKHISTLSITDTVSTPKEWQWVLHSSIFA